MIKKERFIKYINLLILMEAPKVIEALDNIVIKEEKDSEALRELKERLIKYSSPETPSYERRWRGMSVDVINTLAKMKYRHTEELSSIIDDLQKWEESLGYRSNILTAQEHYLEGSTPSSVGVDPYIPLCLLENKDITLEEVRTARELQKFTRVYVSFYIIPNFDVIFTHKSSVIRTYLEPLDNNGRTIRDPTPVNNNLKIIEKFGKTNDFPYKR